MGKRGELYPPREKDNGRAAVTLYCPFYDSHSHQSALHTANAAWLLGCAVNIMETQVMPHREKGTLVQVWSCCHRKSQLMRNFKKMASAPPPPSGDLTATLFYSLRSWRASTSLSKGNYKADSQLSQARYRLQNRPERGVRSGRTSWNCLSLMACFGHLPQPADSRDVQRLAGCSWLAMIYGVVK